MCNFTTKLLGLGSVSVDNVEENENCIIIDVSTAAHEVICPCCGHKTKKIHDYRIQEIKDIPYRGKKMVIRLKKRRYVCSCCGKKIPEKYDFLPRYYHMTQRVYVGIMRECESTASYNSIAIRFGVSTNTVSRVIDIYNRSMYRCPSVLSIDEFKGNAGDKYQCILAEPCKHKVLDILKNRDSATLIDYFKAYKDRNRVKVFVSDMYKPYREIAQTYFPNALFVVDKYHYTRQVYWALDKVRKEVQKHLTKEKRIYFKHSKGILFKEYEKLKEENKQALSVMLSFSEELYRAWLLKEEFRKFLKCSNSTEGRKVLGYWIELAEEFNIPEFKDCLTAFHNWFPYILNSLDVPYTNGFIEGKNNKIKVLKRNAFGVQNFERFRKRILLACG